MSDTARAHRIFRCKPTSAIRVPRRLRPPEMRQARQLLRRPRRADPDLVALSGFRCRTPPRTHRLLVSICIAARMQPRGIVAVAIPVDEHCGFITNGRTVGQEARTRVDHGRTQLGRVQKRDQGGNVLAFDPAFHRIPERHHRRFGARNRACLETQQERDRAAESRGWRNERPGFRARGHDTGEAADEKDDSQQIAQVASRRAALPPNYSTVTLFARLRG